MKQAIEKIGILLTLFLFMVPQVAANDVSGASSEEQLAIEAAERYLLDWAYNSYMYTDKDLTAGTVIDAGVETDELMCAAAKITRQDTIEHFVSDDTARKEHSVNAAVAEMKANMQFMKDKAMYFSEIRQYNGLQRTDFSVDYEVKSANVQGNVAVVNVVENINFQYVGVEDPSFCQEEHTVSLIKVGNEWIIANVETEYDWFDAKYKRSSFEVGDIIEEEKGNIRMQAINSANASLSVEETNEDDAELIAAANSGAISIRPYNNENAWKYAYTYITSKTTADASSYYNTTVFGNFTSQGGDCMNFASQSIYAGFSGSNDLATIRAGKSPQDTVGLDYDPNNPITARTKWYARPTDYRAWISCSAFRNYLDYSASDSETRLCAVKKEIEATSDFSAVGKNNLPGSIIHVTGSTSLGHAIIVNNATGTARNQIFYTAHTSNAKNINLTENYSGKMISIRPTNFYTVTPCSNGRHGFVSGNSKCMYCGFIQTYITPTLLAPMAKNTRVTLSARVNHTVASLSMTVTNPNGVVATYGAVNNTNVISKVYIPTVAEHPNDLYTVKVTAVSADGVTTESTWTFRAY